MWSFGIQSEELGIEECVLSDFHVEHARKDVEENEDHGHWEPDLDQVRFVLAAFVGLFGVPEEVVAFGKQHSWRARRKRAGWNHLSGDLGRLYAFQEVGVEMGHSQSDYFKKDWFVSRIYFRFKFRKLFQVENVNIRFDIFLYYQCWYLCKCA